MICDPRGGDLGDDELTWRDEVWSPVREVASVLEVPD